MQYIHFNRHHNTMLIDDAVKKIEELKEEMAEVKEEIAEVKEEIVEVKEEVAEVKKEIAGISQDKSLPKTLEALTVPPEVETTPFFRRNYPDFPIVWNEHEAEQEEEE